MCKFVETCSSFNYFLYFCMCIVAAAHVVVTNGWRERLLCRTSWVKNFVTKILMRFETK